MAITVVAGTTMITVGTVNGIVKGIETGIETTAAAEKTIEVATGLGSENVIEAQEEEAEIAREGVASTTGTEITLDVTGTEPVVVTGTLTMMSTTTVTVETVSAIMNETLTAETDATTTVSEKAIEEIETEREMTNKVKTLTEAGSEVLSVVLSVIEVAISIASMIAICH